MQTKTPRDILTALIHQSGPDLCDDVQRLENLLKDLCPEHPLEIAVLVTAAKANVPRTLTGSAAQAALLPRLQAQLVARQGLSDANARWAVESWALALDVITAQQCTTPPRLAPPAGAGTTTGGAHPTTPWSEPVDRYYRAWKEDLLDYSRRNPLLYYRPTKTASLEILEPDVAALYQKLYVRPARLTFSHYRMEIVPVDDQETAERRPRHRYRYVLERRGNLVADKEEGELLRALANVRNRARASRTELGLNTLYLALGLLHWIDPSRAEEAADAPLVLVPVNIERAAGQRRYSLVYFDEEIVVNPTLVAYMSDPRIGYDLTLPDFQAPDDDPAALTRYLEEVEQCVVPRGWSVTHRAVLRSFAFHTIRMAEDLEQARLRHYYPGVVRMLAGETAGAQPHTPAPAPPARADLDAVLHPRDVFQVLDADASQVSALAAARSGEHLVIHGPPGTGKSQTIVNLIAQSVAAGKTVLFVSQKNAALEVVYRRLTEIGLDIFCLPVHSDRANKRAVLDEIQRVYAPPAIQAAPAAPQTYESLYHRRLTLNQIAEELNRPLGLRAWTIQRAHGHLFRLRDVPDVGADIGLEGFSYLEVDGAEWQAKQDAAQILAAAYRQLGTPPEHHPWRNLTRQTTPAVRAEIRAAVAHVHTTLEAVTAYSAQAAPSLRLPVPDRRSGLAWLAAVAHRLAAAPDLRPAWLLEPDLNALRQEAEAGRAESKTVHTGRAALDNAGAAPGLDNLDHAALHQQLAEGRDAVDDLLAEPYRPGDRAARASLAAALRRARDAAVAAQALCDQLSGATGMVIHPTDHWLIWGGELARLCATGVQPPLLWFDPQALDGLAELFEHAELASQQYHEARGRVLAQWTPSALTLDPGDLSETHGAFRSPARRLLARDYRDWRLRMAGFWREPGDRPSYRAITALITDLERIGHARRWYESYAERLRESMGVYNRGVETDHAALRQAIAQTREIVDHVGAIPIEAEVRQRLARGVVAPAAWAALHTASGEAATELAAAVDALDRHLDPDVYRPRIQSGTMVHAGRLAGLANQALAALTQIDAVYDRATAHLSPPPDGLEPLADALRTAHAVLEAEAAIARRDDHRRRAFGPAYAGLETDWQPLIEAIAYTQALQTLLRHGDAARGRHPAGDVARQGLAEALRAPDSLKRQAAGIHERATELLAQFDTAYATLAGNFAQDTVPGADPFTNPDPNDLPFARLMARTLELRDNSDRLNDWQQYRDGRDAVETHGLGDLAREALEEKGLPPALLPRIVEKRFYQLWLTEAYTQVEHVGHLQSEQIRREIDAFCDLDEALLVDQRQRVLQAWQTRRPAVSGSVPNSQAGILTREFQKRRAHMPLRRLFGQLPELILALKPCLLMSPLSVAAYLDLETFYRRFDLVVFDEASQVRPAYAIGAILRAQQAVVVGDMKQLPPTDFFRVSREMDDDVEEDEDAEALPPASLESVLGEFITMPGVRQSHLLWHYRSRHEALIQFSNHRYYDDRLVTFPAPLVNAHDRALRCVYVEGVYDRGRTRQNQEEARRVVELIAEHLRTFGATRSLGVITMSTAQEQAIRDELQYQQIAVHLPAIRRHRPFLNEDAHTPEPFFIKSLERVQGDERDSIIISVGYGPDAEGKVYQNFGPLVMEGGERRLNVAITRAKHTLTLVTSLKPDDIQVSEESKPGLVHLKQYIAYTQHDNARPQAERAGRTPEPDGAGAFEQAVRSALASLGYTVDTGVGAGVYTIDLAIRHPAEPDRYLLGLESDGATYAGAATARDRHRLRRQMLETVMGWRLETIWSKAWAERPHLVLEDLQATIARLLAAPEPEHHPPRPTAQDAARDGAQEIAQAAPDANPDAGGDPAPPDLPDDDAWREALQTRIYRPYAAPRAYTKKQFYEDQTRRDRCLLAIVRAEAPIHETTIQERLMACFHVSRATAKFKQTTHETLQRLAARGDLHLQDGFATLRETDAPIIPRVPSPNGEPRRLDHIAIAEIAALCRQIAGQIYGIHQNALARQATYVFGHPVLTARRKARVLEAIRWLEAQGAITVKNGYVFIVESN